MRPWQQRAKPLARRRPASEGWPPPSREPPALVEQQGRSARRGGLERLYRRQGRPRVGAIGPKSHLELDHRVGTLEGHEPSRDRTTPWPASASSSQPSCSPRPPP